ncbi:MAG: hypothetical protein OHK0012_09810 [Synechococcales cyanobacterium]
MSRVVNASSVWGIRGTLNSNPSNQLGGLLVRDGVVVVMTAASDWDEGAVIDVVEPPPPQANKLKQRIIIKVFMSNQA